MLDYDHYLELEDLRLRVRDLEAKVENLRMSRRVLMNILEASERGKRLETEKLERINDRLRRENRRYAQRLMEQNRLILALQEQLRQLGGGRGGVPQKKRS
ncbi:MAG: translation initiation factor 2 [bacterium]